MLERAGKNACRMSKKNIKLTFSLIFKTHSKAWMFNKVEKPKFKKNYVEINFLW